MAGLARQRGDLRELVRISVLEGEASEALVCAIEGGAQMWPTEAAALIRPDGASFMLRLARLAELAAGSDGGRPSGRTAGLADGIQAPPRAECCRPAAPGDQVKRRPREAPRLWRAGPPGRRQQVASTATNYNY